MVQNVNAGAVKDHIAFWSQQSLDNLPSHLEVVFCQFWPCLYSAMTFPFIVGWHEVNWIHWLVRAMLVVLRSRAVVDLVLASHTQRESTDLETNNAQCALAKAVGMRLDAVADRSKALHPFSAALTALSWCLFQPQWQVITLFWCTWQNYLACEKQHIAPKNWWLAISWK